ncbi:MAG: TetR/AcrR family transcriptional regulator [Cryobacterium sp.]|nr:TetR/AcrR family transcriptional regulator [Cryobacterium sp.]
MSSVKAERIPATERREQILEAASRVFGERGYVGATTDQVARAAGISQPYVVRLFGTKENLFIEVFKRAFDKLFEAFRQAIAESKRLGEEGLERRRRIGSTYADLVTDRGILLSLMQGFISGQEPKISEFARTCFLEVYQLLRDEGEFDPEEAVQTLARGMLFNTLLAMRMVEECSSGDECALELLMQTFGVKFEMVVGSVSQSAKNPG